MFKELFYSLDYTIVSPHCIEIIKDHWEIVEPENALSCGQLTFL